MKTQKVLYLHPSSQLGPGSARLDENYNVCASQRSMETPANGSCNFFRNIAFIFAEKLRWKRSRWRPLRLLWPPLERPPQKHMWWERGGRRRGLNASSLDEIWRLKRHTDRSPNSLRGDSWASVPNMTCVSSISCPNGRKASRKRSRGEREAFSQLARVGE